jgi:hypothetical protein
MSARIVSLMGGRPMRTIICLPVLLGVVCMCGRAAAKVERMRCLRTDRQHEEERTFLITSVRIVPHGVCDRTFRIVSALMRSPDVEALIKPRDPFGKRLPTGEGLVRQIAHDSSAVLWASGCRGIHVRAELTPHRPGSFCLKVHLWPRGDGGVSMVVKQPREPAVASVTMSPPSNCLSPPLLGRPAAAPSAIDAPQAGTLPAGKPLCGSSPD